MKVNLTYLAILLLTYVLYLPTARTRLNQKSEKKPKKKKEEKEVLREEYKKAAKETKQSPSKEEMHQLEEEYQSKKSESVDAKKDKKDRKKAKSEDLQKLEKEYEQRDKKPKKDRKERNVKENKKDKTEHLSDLSNEQHDDPSHPDHPDNQHHDDPSHPNHPDNQHHDDPSHPNHPDNIHQVDPDHPDHPDNQHHEDPNQHHDDPNNHEDPSHPDHPDNQSHEDQSHADTQNHVENHDPSPNVSTRKPSKRDKTEKDNTSSKPDKTKSNKAENHQDLPQDELQHLQNDNSQDTKNTKSKSKSKSKKKKTPMSEEGIRIKTEKGKNKKKKLNYLEEAEHPADLEHQNSAYNNQEYDHHEGQENHNDSNPNHNQNQGHDQTQGQEHHEGAENEGEEQHGQHEEQQPTKQSKKKKNKKNKYLETPPEHDQNLESPNHGVEGMHSDDEDYYVKKEKTRKKKNKDKKGKKKRPSSFPKVNTNVIELTKKNVNSTLSSPKGKYLVFVYEKYYGKSLDFNNLMDELSLEKEKHGLNDIAFLKLNARKLRAYADNMGVHDYPALVFIANEQELNSEYEGEPHKESVINFVHRIIKEEVTEVSSFENFKKAAKVGSNLLLVGDKTKFKKEFEKIVKYSKKYFINFYQSDNQEFFQKFKIPVDEFDAVAFFTINHVLNEGERLHLAPADIKRARIFQKTEIYSRSPLAELNHHKLESVIYNKLKTVFFLYNNKTDQGYSEVEASLKNLANKYREDYWFLKGSIEKPVTEVISEIFHIQPTDLPTLVLVDNIKSNKFELDQYSFPKNTTLNPENAEKFILDHINGHLQRQVISEPLSNVFPRISEEEKLKHIKLIEDSKNNTNTTNEEHEHQAYDHVLLEHVIAFTFENDVFNNAGKDVVLFGCSSVEFCKRPENRFRRSIRKLGKNDKIFFAMTDVLYNELPGLEDVSKLPFLLIVPDITVNKEKKHVVFDGEFTTLNIIEFIKKHAVHPISNILDLENEKQVLATEKKRKVKYQTREEIEAGNEVEQGYPAGGGFEKSVNRFIFQYHESDRSDDEGVDHDIEDYDTDEQNSRWIKVNRDDL